MTALTTSGWTPHTYTNFAAIYNDFEQGILHRGALVQHVYKDPSQEFSRYNWEVLSSIHTSHRHVSTELCYTATNQICMGGFGAETTHRWISLSPDSLPEPLEKIVV